METTTVSSSLGGGGAVDEVRNLEIDLLRSVANLEYVGHRLNNDFTRAYPDVDPIVLLSRLRGAQAEVVRLREELDEINAQKSRFAECGVPLVGRTKARADVLGARAQLAPRSSGAKDSLGDFETLAEKWSDWHQKPAVAEASAETSVAPAKSKSKKSKSTKSKSTKSKSAVGAAAAKTSVAPAKSKSAVAAAPVKTSAAPAKSKSAVAAAPEQEQRSS